MMTNDSRQKQPNSNWPAHAPMPQSTLTQPLPLLMTQAEGNADAAKVLAPCSVLVVCSEA